MARKGKTHTIMIQPAIVQALGPIAVLSNVDLETVVNVLIAYAIIQAGHVGETT